MSAEEITNLRSSLETVYENIDGTPCRLGQKNGLWYILMGNTVLEKQGFNTTQDAKKWINDNTLILARQIAATVCYDMIKPYIQMNEARLAGVQINTPEVTNQNQ